MMARMLTQVPLPLLPHDAAEIAPGVGVVTGPDGSGVVWVHGLATFAWDAGDETARRLAAVQLVQLSAATQVQVAQAFGVIPVSVWRWAKALAGGGVAGLIPAVKGPQRASKLTPPPASALAHRHTLTGITPKASATCTCVAAFSCTSWTAASRRAASSPASHANVASPCTHTTPPPSGPATTPTPGAISAASCGSSGSGTWVSIRAIIPPHSATANLSSIIAERRRGNKRQHAGKRDKRPDQQARDTP